MFNIFRRKEYGHHNKSQSLADRLEVAKQKLIADLEQNGMEFLIKSMACDDDYSDLIKEWQKINRSYSNVDSVSWYAYRQSEKLMSSEDKEKLLDLLSNESYSGHKLYIYCCLSSICSNTNDKVLFNFLVDAVQAEEDERTRVSILSRLEGVVKDSGYNIEPIKLLVKEGTSDENRAAIRALSNTNDPEIEDLLLDEFKMASKHMRGRICRSLSTVGTLKSVPILKAEYKKTRDGALRMTIDDAVNKIESRAKAGTREG